MQCLFEELALVKAVANFLKNNTCDLKCRVLHTHLLVHQLADDLLNKGNLLDSVLGMFGDDCTQKDSKCRHKVLHLFRPVCQVLSDGLGKHLVIRLKFRAVRHESCVQLESVPTQISEILLNDKVKSRR